VSFSAFGHSNLVRECVISISLTPTTTNKYNLYVQQHDVQKSSVKKSWFTSQFGGFDVVCGVGSWSPSEAQGYLRPCCGV